MKALIVWGGWDGHQPKQVGEIIEKALKAKGFEVRVENSLDPLKDVEAVKALDLVVPVWTMGQMAKEQWAGLDQAVKSGVGVGGVHGGMGDAFRGNLGYEWMVGGLFVGHPHVGEYTVKLTAKKSPITEGLPKEFPYKSEQYYMMTDPGNTVLATTDYAYEGRKAKMPVVWTKSWGQGRVFYSSLGHAAQEFTDFPNALEIAVRGMIWAAEGKAKAKK